MKSYQEALEKLGKRSSRKLENHTYLIHYHEAKPHYIGIRLHNTDVVKYYQDGRIVLNSGGWKTPTTKDRINKYAPVNVWTDKGIWYIGQNWNKPAEAIYQDDMVINPDGTFSGVMTMEQAKEETKLRGKVRKYAKDFVTALKAGKIPMPSSGDCWYCSQVVSSPDVYKGQPLGKVMKDKNHILSHIKEKYYVPSLAVNALEAFGASMAAKSTLWFYMGHENANDWGEFALEQIEKSVKRYVYRELGLAY
jgi:3'-phosphoadenosine 5'-phosphosulfate sulfotransferase (PAPS reductase)/FAD synthetase